MGEEKLEAIKEIVGEEDKAKEIIEVRAVVWAVLAGRRPATGSRWWSATPALAGLQGRRMCREPRINTQTCASCC